jgi:hypothetical protein
MDFFIQTGVAVALEYKNSCSYEGKIVGVETSEEKAGVSTPRPSQMGAS